ncbi:fatty acid desaturase [Tateyamaria sp. SN6-1]|uniref:fatty acid desaturase n=1 Tax=Tateyamaria sp. SN6-1 TaxID=3092148 RepID=UPI0039F4988C
MEKPPKGVAWHDLTGLDRWQTVRELALPLPWLLLSWALYATAWWPLGLLASFMFFLCGLRLNHEAIHGNLGLSRAGDSIVMHVLSPLMLGSNHAEAFCHLKHHKHAMGPDDFEGQCGRMSAVQVLAYGPRFPVDVNRGAWVNGSRYWRVRMLRDWALIVVFVGVLLWLGAWWGIMHLAAMAAGQCMSAFFAVWITHQGTEHSGLAGRSQRGPLAWMAYLMFYHREHHLFPRVPVSRLPVLADRLDADVPGYAASRAPVVPLWDRA